MLVFTMRAIRINETGGADKLRLEQLPDPVPGPGEALVRLAASGLNFIDIYQRTGLYQRPLPYTPGSEGAGTVIAVGADVSAFKVGDKVVTTGGILGSITKLSDQSIQLQIAPNVRVEVSRAAVVG